MVELNRERLQKHLESVSHSYSLRLNELKEININFEGIKKINANVFKDFTNLEKLWLNNNDIEKIEVKSFENLKNLKYLNLRCNKLKRIDSNLFTGLFKLEELELDYNIIEEIEGKSFESLSNLKYLNLSSNKLKRIDSKLFVGLIVLEELELDYNIIEEIVARSFESLSSLKSLYLNSNKLKRIDSNIFIGMDNLETLWLNNNVIEEINVKSFESLSNLNTLVLAFNKLKRVDSNLFIGLEKLEKLWLNNNFIERINGKPFESLPILKYLNLNSNKLKTIDSNTFIGLFILEELDLDYNVIEEIGAKSFESILSLKLLALGFNKLKRIDSNLFIGMENLETLCLNNNAIEEINLESFEGLSNLKSLSLNGNMMKEIDTKCFEPLKSIEVIEFYGNKDLNFLSYFIPSTKLDERVYFREKIEINGFFSDWTAFLNHFINIEKNENEKIELQKQHQLEIRELRERLQKTLIEKERINSTARQLKDALEKEIQEKEEKKAKELLKKRNLEEEIESLLGTFRIRRVKCENISSLCITTYSKREEIIGQVIDKKYKVEMYLGRGTFGQVYTVLALNDKNKINVIKLIKSTEEADEWEREAMLLSRLNHKNIVKYQDHFLMISKEEIEHPCILTEYCQNGDLAKKIRQKQNKRERFDDKTILNWIFEATDGVRYLHLLKVIHRDIKPQNILLTHDNVIKLADLGTAKMMIETIRANTYAGTIDYMSPELRARKDYSFATDIWSLGCVLFELVYLKFASINKGKEEPSPFFSSSIKRMLAELPNERIDAKQLYENFEKLKEILDM